MANIYPEAILNFKKDSLSFVGGILGFYLNYHTLRSHLETNRQSGKQDKFIQYMGSTQPILFWRKDMEFPCKRKRNGRENRDSKEREEGYGEETVSWM